MLHLPTLQDEASHEKFDEEIRSCERLKGRTKEIEEAVESRAILKNIECNFLDPSNFISLLVMINLLVDP
jgi:hypothetical protein